MKLDVNEDTMTRAPDDWVVNRDPNLLNPNLLQGYDLRLALPEVPSSIVRRPLYGTQSKKQDNFSEKEEDSVASDDERVPVKTPRGSSNTTPYGTGGDFSIDSARCVSDHDNNASMRKGKRKHDEEVCIVEQLKDRAENDGYQEMTSYQKLHYLYDRTEELDEERRKRKAIEDVQEGWLKKERAKAVQQGINELDPIQGPSPSQAKADPDSDYEDDYSPPRMTHASNQNPNNDSHANPASPIVHIPYSPLRFKCLPLDLPAGSTEPDRSRPMVLSDSEDESD